MPKLTDLQKLDRSMHIAMKVREGMTANDIQAALKGTQYAMRRTELLKVIRSENEKMDKQFLKDIRTAKGIKPERKKIIIAEYKKGMTKKDRKAVRKIYKNFHPNRLGFDYIPSM